MGTTGRLTSGTLALAALVSGAQGEDAMTGKAATLYCDGGPEGFCEVLARALSGGDTALDARVVDDAAGADFRLEVLRFEEDIMDYRLHWHADGEAVAGPDVNVAVLGHRITPAIYEEMAKGLILASKPPI